MLRIETESSVYSQSFIEKFRFMSWEERLIWACMVGTVSFFIILPSAYLYFLIVRLLLGI